MDDTTAEGKKFCGARRRQGEGFCRRPAGWGTDHVGVGHCKLHGGSTKSHRTKAATAILDAQVKGALERQGVEPVHDPIAQLSLLAGEVVALKDVLGAQVAELKSWSHFDGNDKEEVRVLVVHYERALAQCHRILTDMARLDLDARLVRVSEAQADLLQQVIEAVLCSPEVGLDPERLVAARAVLAKELTRAAAA